ncbi:hypothetical protein FB446DRAFT_709691 [Lentinula raphanica]|nr:hypothetical protein FB446DRAFT_709691 [Lentinula raphanica]
MSSEPSTTSLAAHSALTLINSCALSVKEWEQHNICLAGIIYQNIKDPCFLGVTEVMTAHQMWVHLTKYFKQLEVLHKAASNSMKCIIPDEDLHSWFMTSLGPEHLWIIQNYGSQTYLKLKRALIGYHMMVESATSSSANTIAPNALVIPSCLSSGGIVCNNSTMTLEVQSFIIIWDVTTKWDKPLFKLIRALQSPELHTKPLEMNDEL